MNSTLKLIRQKLSLKSVTYHYVEKQKRIKKKRFCINTRTFTGLFQNQNVYFHGQNIT